MPKIDVQRIGICLLTCSLALISGCPAVDGDGGAPFPISDENNDGASNATPVQDGEPVVIVNTDPLSRHAAQIQMPDGAIVDCWVKRDEAGNIEYASHFRAFSFDGGVEYLQIDELGRPVRFIDSEGYGFNVDEYLDQSQALVTYFNGFGEQAQAIVDLAAAPDKGLAIDQKALRTAKALNQNAARWPSDRLCEALRAGIDGACLTLNIISAITSSACVLAIVVDIITVPSGEGPVACAWLNSIVESLIISMLCGISEFAVDDVCSRARKEPLGERDPPQPPQDFTISIGSLCGGDIAFSVAYRPPNEEWSRNMVSISGVCAETAIVYDDTLHIEGRVISVRRAGSPWVDIFDIEFEFIGEPYDLGASVEEACALPGIDYAAPHFSITGGFVSLHLLQSHSAWQSQSGRAEIFVDETEVSPPPFGEMSSPVIVHCGTETVELASFVDAPFPVLTTGKGGDLSLLGFHLGSPDALWSIP